MWKYIFVGSTSFPRKKERVDGARMSYWDFFQRVKGLKIYIMHEKRARIIFCGKGTIYQLIPLASAPLHCWFSRRRDRRVSSRRIISIFNPIFSGFPPSGFWVLSEEISRYHSSPTPSSAISRHKLIIQCWNPFAASLSSSFSVHRNVLLALHTIFPRFLSIMTLNSIRGGCWKNTDDVWKQKGAEKAKREKICAHCDGRLSS